MLAGGIQQDLLRQPGVGFVRDWDGDLLPKEWEVARVVIHRLVEILSLVMVTMRSPTSNVLPRRITKCPANDVITSCKAKATPTLASLRRMKHSARLKPMSTRRMIRENTGFLPFSAFTPTSLTLKIWSAPWGQRTGKPDSRQRLYHPRIRNSRCNV